MNTFFYKDQRIKKDNIPNDVLFILKKLKDSGFLSFLVGGCVRDMLLERTVRDWDIVTDAKINQIKIIFREYKILLIGEKFQTATLVLNHKVYQISSFRNNGTQNLHDYQEELFQRLQNDLICRDFTINAIVWNENRGIFDPTNGLRDLNQKMLQSINPDMRFKEDPLRMLRAVRIACELDFAISAEIKRSIYRYAALVHYVHVERIRNEISLILKYSDAKRGILLLQQFGLESHIFSLDKVKKPKVNKKVRKRMILSGLDKLKGNLPAQLALWGRLYFGSCQSARVFYFSVIRCLRYDKKITAKIKILLSREWEDLDFSSDVKVRFLLAHFGKEIAELMMLLKKTLLFENNELQQNQLKLEERLLRDELGRKYPIKLSDLAINGNDLIEMGISEGKIIGDILKTIFQKVIVNPEINHKDILIKFVQELIRKNAKKEI